MHLEETKRKRFNVSIKNRTEVIKFGKQWDYYKNKLKVYEYLIHYTEEKMTLTTTILQ